MPKKTLGLLLGGFLLVTASAAHAAPVSVTLRVEGPTRTLFEGPVTTDVRAFAFSDSPGTTHTCDGTAAIGGPSPTPVPTRNAALLAAAQSTPFSITGKWFDGIGASFDQINGERVAFDPATNRYLVEYKNNQSSELGGCADPISNGDDVLYAFGTGSETLLALSGPATATPGQAVALKVTNAATGAPVAGATVAGRTSGADGAVSAGPFAGTGNQDLKASKDGAIRSNRARICVTNGSDGLCGTVAPGTPGVAGVPGLPGGPCQTAGDDGLCGTVDRRAALGRITSIREQQRFARRQGPRVLSGRVDSDASGLKEVRLRLTRNNHGHCSQYDAKRERFRRMKRCRSAAASFFAAGNNAEWSYLLPARLGRGRYVLDVRAIDGRGNADTALARGRNRIVFVVR